MAEPVALLDLPLLAERCRGDLGAECTRSVCFEPEVHELAEVVLALLARLSAAERALNELANVPDAGPFPNKGACRAFAGYVQSVARAALAGREETT